MYGFVCVKWFGMFGGTQILFWFFRGNIALLVCRPQETNDFFFFDGKEANGFGLSNKEKEKRRQWFGLKIKVFNFRF